MSLVAAKAHLAGILADVTGIQAVYAQSRLQPPEDANIPALMIELIPADVSLKATTTRRYEWPFRVWINLGRRTDDIAVDEAAILPYPERVIDAIDAASTFGGLLSRTVEFESPAVSHPGLDKFWGYTAWNATDEYIETAVHARMTTQRVGGFGPNG